jgi:hypothetical protein
VYRGDGELIEEGDYSGFGGAARALAEAPDVAVLETARGGILLRGIGVMHNDVAVVTNVSEGLTPAKHLRALRDRDPGEQEDSEVVHDGSHHPGAIPACRPLGPSRADRNGCRGNNFPFHLVSAEWNRSDPRDTGSEVLRVARLEMAVRYRLAMSFTTRNDAHLLRSA